MPSSKPTVLGGLLHSRRRALGFSRTRVAELSRVNASTIEAWEVGRVSKPPLHDVLRLARVLGISPAELERAAMEESEVPPARAGGAVPLLERAIALLGWSEDDAAGALNTAPARVQGLRAGREELSVLEVMSLIALLAAFPPGRGGASEHEVSEMLAHLRSVPL